jgi:hypothetical protein
LLNITQHVSRIKDKNNMSISVDAENSFDKIQNPLIIEDLKKLGIQEMYLNIINLHSVNHLLKTESNFSEFRNETRMSNLFSTIQNIS